MGRCWFDLLYEILFPFPCPLSLVIYRECKAVWVSSVWDYVYAEMNRRIDYRWMEVSVHFIDIVDR